MLYLCTLTSYSVLRLLMLEICCQLDKTNCCRIASPVWLPTAPGICSWQAKMLLKSWAYGERRGNEETDSMATEPGAMESQSINRINVHQLPSTLLFRSIGPWVLPSTRWIGLGHSQPALPCPASHYSCLHILHFAQSIDSSLSIEITQQTTAARPEGAPWCVHLKSAFQCTRGPRAQAES